MTNYEKHIERFILIDVLQFTLVLKPFTRKLCTWTKIGGLYIELLYLTVFGFVSLGSVV